MDVWQRQKNNKKARGLGSAELDASRIRFFANIVTDNGKAGPIDDFLFLMLEQAATQDGNPDLVYIGDLLGGNIRVHAAVAILSKGELSGIATPRGATVWPPLWFPGLSKPDQYPACHTCGSYATMKTGVRFTIGMFDRPDSCGTSSLVT